MYLYLYLYSEYLATFKKTVAMHEVFLQRLTAHPRLRGDSVFTVFLEFEGDVSKSMHVKATNSLIFFVQLSIRQKNTWERLGSLFKGIAKLF